jgi:hypothetical protein
MNVIINNVNVKKSHTSTLWSNADNSGGIIVNFEWLFSCCLCFAIHISRTPGKEICCITSLVTRTDSKLRLDQSRPLARSDNVSVDFLIPS